MAQGTGVQRLRRVARAGRRRLANAVIDARSQGPQRRHRQEVGRPDDHQRRCDHRREIELEDPTRTSAPSSPRRSRPRPTTSPVTDDDRDGPAQAMVHEGLRNVAAGANPIRPQAGMDKAVQAVNGGCSRNAREVEGKDEIAQVASPLRRRTGIGETIAGPSTRSARTASSPSRSPRRRPPSSSSPRACSSTRATSRPTSSPTPSAWRPSSRTPTSSSPGQDLGDRRRPAGAGEGRPGRQAAVHHRRGRRRRGCPRSSSTRSAAPSTSVAVKAPASVTAARRCSRTWRSSPVARSSPRGRPQARPGRPRPARPGPPRRGHLGQHDDHRRRRRPRRRRGARQPDQGRDRATDSDWDREKLQERLAKLAGGVCVIKVGAPPRSSSRRRSTASRTPSRDPRGHRGGHRRRWRLGPHPGRQGHRRPRSGDEEKVGAKIVRRPPPSRCAGSPRTPASGYVAVAKVSDLGRYGPQRRHRRLRDLAKPASSDPVKVTRSALRQRRVDRVDGPDHRHALSWRRRRRRSPPPVGTVTATATIGSSPHHLVCRAPTSR